MKCDSVGKVSRGWDRNILRSSVVPLRGQPTMKMGAAVIRAFLTIISSVNFGILPPPHIIMATIGIDASRANAPERSGAEWYAYHLIEALKGIETPGIDFVL